MRCLQAILRERGTGATAFRRSADWLTVLARSRHHLYCHRVPAPNFRISPFPCRKFGRRFIDFPWQHRNAVREGRCRGAARSPSIRSRVCSISTSCSDIWVSRARVATRICHAPKMTPPTTAVVVAMLSAVARSILAFRRWYGDGHTVRQFGSPERNWSPDRQFECITCWSAPRFWRSPQKIRTFELRGVHSSPLCDRIMTVLRGRPGIDVSCEQGRRSSSARCDEEKRSTSPPGAAREARPVATGPTDASPRRSIAAADPGIGNSPHKSTVSIRRAGFSAT